jgi:hypothetical protein
VFRCQAGGWPKKTAGLIEKETKILKISNLKHHLILKLGQINSKLQYPNLNKIKRRLFGILNLGHCDLPFDLAQGG